MASKYREGNDIYFETALLRSGTMFKNQNHRQDFCSFSVVGVILTVSDCAGLSMVEGAEIRESSWAFLHWSADRFLLG